MWEFEIRLQLSGESRAMNNINENETEIKVTLRLHKSMFRILQIFSNIYSRRYTEEQRIEEFLSNQILLMLQSLAEDIEGPAQKDLPLNLKKLITRCLEESKNDIKI